MKQINNKSPNKLFPIYSQPAIAHVPPVSTYAPGMSVLAESQAGKRNQGQGHSLKSFTVPAPPIVSAPGTPQPKHVGKITLKLYPFILCFTKIRRKSTMSS